MQIKYKINSEKIIKWNLINNYVFMYMYMQFFAVFLTSHYWKHHFGGSSSPSNPETVRFDGAGLLLLLPDPFDPPQIATK